MQLVSKYSTATSRGCLSKAWYSSDGNLIMVKGNSDGTVGDYNEYGLEPYSEVLASRLAKLLGLDCVTYWLDDANNYPEIHVYGIEYVSVCYHFGGRQSKHFSVWADIIAGKSIKDYFSFLFKSDLDLTEIYKMFLFDAIIGNQDRHLNNWEIIVDNGTSKLAPLIDFGASLLSLVPDYKLKVWSGIGPDKSKPFKHTHTEQIKLFEKRLGKLSLGCNKVFDQWILECGDIWQLLPQNRVECIQNYVKNRILFYEQVGKESLHEIDAF